MEITTHINLEGVALSKVVKKLNVHESIKSKITINNSRVELKEKDSSLFMIFYVPEYNKETKSIDNVEVNIVFDLESRKIDLFANNSNYFFSKYNQEISDISVKSFGGFFEKFLSLVFEDVSRIVTHILDDANTIRKEYQAEVNTYKLIRHLTSAQINISSLRLIFANQNKLIELVNDYMSKTQQSSLTYKKNFLEEELNYAKEFCETVMSSINTKFQVRTSDDLYRFNKYALVTFISTLFLTIYILYQDSKTADDHSIFYGALALVAISISIVIFTFRNKK